MKLLSLFFLILLVAPAKAQFDQSLADSVGADEYGMRTYVMAFLKRGPNRDRSKEESARLQRAHLDNIGRLAEEGKLVMAGPFFASPEDDLRGIYIFDVDSIEEAQALTETDPAIQAGSLVMELKKWYGSAALKLMLPLSKMVTKKDI
ncbi:YciI family protein [Jiulongibacter sediminis]|nr:YciI family protein [Jiulongibacter sediminis]